MNTMDLINSIEAGKTRDIEKCFEELAQERVDNALEQRQMEMSQDMFADQE